MKGTCPHCKAKIDLVLVEGYISGALMANEDIEEGGREWTTYTCPECGEEIKGDNPEDIVNAVWGKQTNPNNPHPKVGLPSLFNGSE